MFRKAFFKDKSREEIKKAMQREGFTPTVISDSPNYIYEPHHHAETKYLVCLEGAMAVTVKGKVYKFEPGDKLVIPGNTMHSALVDKDGCVFFWSEKIVK